MNKSLHQDDETRARWEEAYVHTRRNLGRRLRRIRTLLDAPLDGLVLEIGCGDCLNLQLLEQLGYRRLIGMDCSIDLLRRARLRPLVAGDAQRLPFATGSITTIFVDSVLHHLTDYRAAASELARVLQPSGRIYYFEPRPSPLRSLLDRLTLSPLARSLPFFSSRRKTLLEERVVYEDWLKNHEILEQGLEANGLHRRYRKTGPISMFLCYEKAGAS